MSDSDDFFGDDSDFDESDEFSSEDAAKEGFIPTKSKNQEEDAADSQRKAEAIAKEEAANAADNAKKETESKTNDEDTTMSESDKGNDEDALEVKVGKNDAEDGIAAGQVAGAVAVPPSETVTEEKTIGAGKDQNDADETEVDEEHDQEQYDEQEEEEYAEEEEEEYDKEEEEKEQYDEQKEEEKEQYDEQEQEEYAEEEEFDEEQDDEEVHAEEQEEEEEYAEVQDDEEEEHEIVESDHARSDSDVADSYDDEHLSASVSEDENGDDASDSQLDVASSEQEEEHALKEGGATPANKDEYTSVQKEQAELMEFCQSRPLPAVENVAATQIQELTRNPTVQQHQRAEELELARLREAHKNLAGALREVNPGTLQHLQQKSVADTSGAESTINSLFSNAGNHADPTNRHAAAAHNIGPPAFDLHNRLPSDRARNRFQYPHEQLPFTKELLKKASRQLPVGPPAMRKPSHKFVRYNGVWVRQKKKTIISKSRRKASTKAKSRKTKTRKRTKSKKTKSEQKGHEYKEVEWHRYAQPPPGAKSRTKHKTTKKKARKQLKRRNTLQVALEVVDHSAQAANAARVAESYAMRALFSHLDPSDPNVFSGMDKGMVRRILDLRDEKGGAVALNPRIASDPSLPRKKRRPKIAKPKASPKAATAAKATPKGQQGPKQKQTTEAQPKKRRRANSIFSPIVQVVFKRIASCYTYSALLHWRATVRTMASFDNCHHKMLRRMSVHLKQIPKGDKPKAKSTKAERETKEMLTRLLCLGGLSKEKMCRILELKRMPAAVDDDEVERLMVQHFKRRSESSWMPKNEFAKLLSEFGVKDDAFVEQAFAAFSTNSSKGVCIFMRFPFARVLAFYFGSMDNEKMTRVDFRNVLRKYAPALFVREAHANAIDQLLYDLDTCSFGVSPPMFMQQVATIPFLNEILCNDPKFFK